MFGLLGRMVTENRKESLFLPVVVFGYIYAKHSSIAICSYNPLAEYTTFVYTGLPRWGYLLGAMLTAVGGAIIYHLREQTEANNEDYESLEDVLREQLSGNRLIKTLTVTIFSVGYLSVSLLSIVALGSRLCNGDLVIVGASAIYLILFVLGNAGRLFN